jgi:hypothetical protein
MQKGDQSYQEKRQHQAPPPPSQANAWRIKYIRTAFSKLHICTVSSYDICKIWYLTESIERFIEDQVFFRSYYYAPRHPLSPTHAESCDRKTVWTSINHSILSMNLSKCIFNDQELELLRYSLTSAAAVSPLPTPRFPEKKESKKTLLTGAASVAPPPKH